MRDSMTELLSAAKEWQRAMFATLGNELELQDIRSRLESSIMGLVDEVLAQCRKLEAQDRRTIFDGTDSLILLLDAFEAAMQRPVTVMSDAPSVPVLMAKLDRHAERLIRLWSCVGLNDRPILRAASELTRRYNVELPALSQRVRRKQLTDYRLPGHAKNAPLILDEREVAVVYAPRC